MVDLRPTGTAFGLQVSGVSDIHPHHSILGAGRPGQY